MKAEFVGGPKDGAVLELRDGQQSVFLPKIIDGPRSKWVNPDDVTPGDMEIKMDVVKIPVTFVDGKAKLYWPAGVL